MVKYQAFRDLDVIIRLYEKASLSPESDLKQHGTRQIEMHFVRGGTAVSLKPVVQFNDIVAVARALDNGILEAMGRKPQQVSVKEKEFNDNAALPLRGCSGGEERRELSLMLVRFRRIGCGHGRPLP